MGAIQAARAALRRKHTRTHTHARTHAHTHTHTHAHTHARKQIHTHIHTHTHRHRHKHRRADSQTHTQARTQARGLHTLSQTILCERDVRNLAGTRRRETRARVTSLQGEVALLHVCPPHTHTQTCQDTIGHTPHERTRIEQRARAERAPLGREGSSLSGEGEILAFTAPPKLVPLHTHPTTHHTTPCNLTSPAKSRATTLRVYCMSWGATSEKKAKRSHPHLHQNTHTYIRTHTWGATSEKKVRPTNWNRWSAP